VAIAGVRALLFDVFGTVVDWRGSVIRAGAALTERTGADVDWPAFADRWRREGYLAPIGRIVAREEPWRDVDSLLQAQFDVLASDVGFLDLPDAELAPLRSIWSELDPWRDSVEGLLRLRRSFVVAPLSNGGFAQLTTMAKRAGLRAAYVPRPLEWGEGSPPPDEPDGSFDLVAGDFSALADALGC
jgi:2-haloacid dehalogenase